MCAVSMLVGAPRNCSRFVCRYGFHEDVLDSVYVPILLYCCTRIQSRVEVNFVDVCGFDARRGSPELQQVRLPVRFSRRRLRFSLRTHTSVLLYSDTVKGRGKFC